MVTVVVVVIITPNEMVFLHHKAARKPTEATVGQLCRKSVVTDSLSSDRRPSEMLPIRIT